MNITMILQQIFDDIESHDLHISEQPVEFADPHCEGAAMTHEFRNRIVTSRIARHRCLAQFRRPHEIV